MSVTVTSASAVVPRAGRLLNVIPDSLHDESSTANACVRTLVPAVPAEPAEEAQLRAVDRGAGRAQIELQVADPIEVRRVLYLELGGRAEVRVGRRAVADVGVGDGRQRHAAVVADFQRRAARRADL